MKTSRTVVTAGIAVAALGGAFALGTTVGNGTSPETGTPGRPPATAHKAGAALASGDLALVAAGTCDDLLEWYVDNTRDQVTAWGWGGGNVLYYGRDSRAGAVEDMAVDAPMPTAAGTGPWAGAEAEQRTLTKSQTSSETGTNVQEAGVDEPDVVKTNGEILVRLDGDDLATSRARRPRRSAGSTSRGAPTSSPSSSSSGTVRWC
jgi:hypothetical protein